MKMICNRFFFPHHNWGRWKKIEEGTRTRKYFDGDDLLIGVYIRQQRQCIDCHFIELKDLHTDES